MVCCLPFASICTFAPSTRLGSRMFPHFFKARKRVAEPVLAGLLLQIIFAPACGMQHPEEQGKVLRLEGLRWEGLPLHAANHWCLAFPGSLHRFSQNLWFLQQWSGLKQTASSMKWCNVTNGRTLVCAEGSASFSLKPGEEYKFCWCLVVGRELQRIVVSRPAQMKTPPFLKMWRITLGWTWVGLYP